jgi:hypothetical protein
MLTGLTIDDDATLVLLLHGADGYRPIALGIRGTYDRYGSIDGIEEDGHTDLVLSYFRDRLREGRFVVDGEAFDADADSIEDLLRCVERNNLWLIADPVVPEPAATLDGAVVSFALVAQPVWTAIAASVGPGAMVDGWFGEIYRERLSEFPELVRQFAAVSEFVSDRGLVWAPPAEPSQRYPTDMGAQYGIVDRRTFLDDARRDLGDVAFLGAVLDEYAAAIEEWENEPSGHYDLAAERERIGRLIAEMPTVEYAMVYEEPDEDGRGG